MTDTPDIIGLLLEREEWKEQAACRGLPIEVFFPDDKLQESRETAIAICMTCPVIQDCRDYVEQYESDGYRYGIYGGLRPSERGPTRSPTGKLRQLSTIQTDIT